MKMYCPMCREENATITLSVNDGDTFRCEDCEEEFSRSEVAAMLTGANVWVKVIAWADSCPSHTHNADE